MNPRLSSTNKAGMDLTARQQIEDASMAHAAPITTTPTFVAVDMDYVIGMVLVAGLPAVFWSALAFVISAAFGAALSLTATGGIGIAIAAFLGLVYRVLASSADTDV